MRHLHVKWGKNLLNTNIIGHNLKQIPAALNERLVKLWTKNKQMQKKHKKTTTTTTTNLENEHGKKIDWWVIIHEGYHEEKKNNYCNL